MPPNDLSSPARATLLGRDRLHAEFEVAAFAVVGRRVLSVLDVDRFQARSGLLGAAKEEHLAPRVNNDRRLDHRLSQFRHAV
jgi:hypothetical protein